MATAITGIKTINIATSELDPNGGITMHGTFNKTGSNFINNADDIYMKVIVDGVTKYLPGTFTFTEAGSTFTFTATQEDLNAAGLTLGTPAKFFFANDGADNIENNGDDFNGTNNSNGGVSVTMCFYPGTMIATPNGEMAVEELSIGDKVLRYDGSEAEVRWMGRNSVMPLFADASRSFPIRIKKDALAENVPSRDLLVSPDHAMFVDGILAQAGSLVNGTSIVRETNLPSKFVYHHIELSEHALIVAENAPTESFVDNIDRMNYDNWAEHEALYGDLPALIEMDLPRAKSRRQVPVSIRQRLDQRAVELGYTAVDAAVA